MPSPRVPSPRSRALRAALAAAGLIGAVLLVVATFATVIRIEVGATTKVPEFDTLLSGWDRHGPALLVLAVFALPMIAGAWRGARPAAGALGVVGVVALALVVVSDVPDLNKVGFIGQVYDNAAAGPAGGFYLETAGAILLLLAGGILLILGPAERAEQPPRRRQRVLADGAGEEG